MNALPPVTHSSAATRDVTVLGVINILLRRRALLVLLPLLLFAAAVTYRMMQPREYTASTSFIPQRSNAAPAGLGNLAAQFGITVPTGDAGESPAFYADLLRSRSVLEPALDAQYAFPWRGGTYTGTLLDFYDIESRSEPDRRDRALTKLRGDVNVSTSRLTDVVRLSVSTRAPALSQQVAAKMLEVVNEFNLESRQSQAGEERRFVETRMEEARAELREAESELAAFLARNAQFARSPTLMLEHDRLQREVMWRQQVFTSLAQAFEQARIEEVRNIPVITIVETAQPPVRPDARGTVKWAMLGIVAGLVIAVILAFLLEYFKRGGAVEPEEFHEFTRLRQDTLHDLRRPWRLLLPARRRTRALPTTGRE